LDASSSFELFWLSLFLSCLDSLCSFFFSLSTGCHRLIPLLRGPVLSSPTKTQVTSSSWAFPEPCLIFFQGYPHLPIEDILFYILLLLSLLASFFRFPSSRLEAFFAFYRPWAGRNELFVPLSSSVVRS
jgi:hypothetical protein